MEQHYCRPQDQPRVAAWLCSCGTQWFGELRDGGWFWETADIIEARAAHKVWLESDEAKAAIEEVNRGR